LKTRAIAFARVSTGNIDVATPAQLLRTDLLPKAHSLSQQARLDQELLRNRAMLMQVRGGAGNRVRALLVRHNPVCGDGGCVC
jgi:hypothetical protein